MGVPLHCISGSNLENLEIYVDLLGPGSACEQ